MTAAAQTGLVLGLIAGLLALMAGLGRLAKARGWPAEVQRKIVHVAAGGLAMGLPWIFAADWPVYLLLGLTLLAMGALRLPVLRAMGGTLHGVDRQSFGDFFLVLGVGLVFLFHDGDPVLYILPLAVLTLADAAAALAGSAYGRTFLKVEEGRKSLEGSAVFFGVTLVVALLCLLFLSETPPGAIIVLAAAIAGFATVVEADSWQGFDNLFLPMGVQIFLIATLGLDNWDIVLRMAFLAAGLTGVAVLARLVGMSAQVARVYGLAMFLLLSVTSLQNAVLPALMLLAQALAARGGGSEGKGLERLDVVGALAIISFGFLAAGEVTGINALSFYALATGTAAAGHIGLALAARPIWMRALGGGLAVLVLYATWNLVMAQNSAAALWHPPIPTAGLMVFVAAYLACVIQPELFARQATTRVALLGAVPAVLIYVGLMMIEGAV